MNNSLQFLDRPEGRIAYDVRGSGPLVVCVSGMSDLRSTYRHLVGPVAEAGFRVATTELRGHGDSDTTFSSYDDEAAASDLVALVELLGEPAVLVGHSMGAGAAVIAASRSPDSPGTFGCGSTVPASASRPSQRAPALASGEPAKFGRRLASGVVIWPISRANFSWSTSVVQSRSVSPFHCDVLAFS